MRSNDFLFLARALLPGLLLAAVAPPARAIDEADLLPVDQAYVLSAEATGPDSIALRWKIADGYYLYRHRTSAQADAAFAAGALQLPPGKVHEDPYFGRVETYRGSLTGTLKGQAGPFRVTVKVKYQGCADAGLCYPPQTRTLSVDLPAAQAPVAFGGAGIGRASNPLLGGRSAAGTDALPLPAEQAFGFEAIARDDRSLLLRFTPAPGYYLYRDRTTLSLTGAPGIALGQPQWPRATPHRDEHFGQVAVYFDQIDVPLPLRRTQATPAEVSLTARFQGCQTDGICYPPMTRTVRVALPALEAAAGAIGATPADGAGSGATSVPDAAAAAASTVAADPAASPAPPADASGAIAPPAVVDAAPPREHPAALRTPRLGLASALLLALLGGLVLNLMPCVLPVLSLKALSLAGHGEDPRSARRHALAYTAGVLLSFLALGAAALALRSAGLALGWGFQLQQPVVVALLGLVMFALALSLSGVWHAGGRWTAAGHGLTTRSGPLGDFFTGVLAVIVATPCTAPFMGAALAWAFTAPTGVALLVFLALGLGLALPFLLIGFVPALAHRLPRPGAWMDTLKQLLAFPLYLTAVWLAWVLARQRGADAIGWWLVAAVGVAFAAWLWTHARRHDRRALATVALLALLATVWPLSAIHRLPRPDATPRPVAAGELQPIPFSEARLAQLRAAGRVVFVDITADWCVTCKANERTVLSQAPFQEAMRAANAAYLVGDWTDVDPALTAYLQRHKAFGVPLYVVYPAGGGEGRVLPTVLTSGLVRSALAEAAR